MLGQGSSHGGNEAEAMWPQAAPWQPPWLPAELELWGTVGRKMMQQTSGSWNEVGIAFTWM